MAFILDALKKRPTIFLDEPLISVLRQRRGNPLSTSSLQIRLDLPYTQEIESEQALEFVRDWARRLAAGWVDRFFPKLPPDERERFIKNIQSEIIKSIATGYPLEVRTRRRRETLPRPIVTETQELQIQRKGNVYEYRCPICGALITALTREGLYDKIYIHMGRH